MGEASPHLCTHTIINHINNRFKISNPHFSISHLGPNIYKIRQMWVVLQQPDNRPKPPKLE